MNLNGKRIIITGASQGLGAVSAKYFAESGAKMALLGRQTERLNALRAGLTGSHTVLTTDLLVSDQITTSIDKALQFLGGIDCVLHTAGGGLGLRDSLISEQDLLTLFRVNLSAAVEINRLVAPIMKSQKHGNLVHVGSTASSEGVGSVGYNTVKAALAAYVRTIGRELASEGVIVTGILPGGFTGPNNSMERLKNNKPEVYEHFIAERLPRKKMGTADELIPLLQFLCTAAAGMMCGCLVPIDGGEGRGYLWDGL